MKQEYFYAGISIFLWSTTATVTKLLLGSLNSMQIMLASSLVAFVFLFFVSLFKGSLKELKSYKLTDYIQISGIGTIGIFLYHLFLYLGIDRMNASQAFIINYLWPIMTMVFACILLKEKMTLQKGIAIYLSFQGVVQVTVNGNLLQTEKSSIVGAVYCIMAALSYGLFCVLNKQKLYNKYLSMMLYYFVAMLISFFYIVFTKDWFVLSVGQTIGMIWIGVFTTATAFTTWALALAKGDTAKISNLAYITPFLSLVWTWLILKEPLTFSSVVGMVMIVSGILIQLKK